MSATFHLHIVTPERDFYSGEIEYLCVDTPSGKMGFMHGAMPRTVVLKAGEMSFKTSVLEMSILCGDGIAMIDSGGATVLVESCRIKGDAPIGEDNIDYSVLSRSEYVSSKAKIATAFKNMKSGSSDDNG